jgi:hypothetical protein
MHVTLTNYLGIQHVDLNSSPLALVIGPNGAGKSSIQAAVAAALTGQPLPAGLNKKDAGTLVHGAGTEAAVTVATEGGSVSVSWPQCEVVTDRKAPQASDIAAGLVRLTDLPAKDRAARLIEVLGAEPSFADLVEAVTTTGILVPPKGDDVAVESLRKMIGDMEASDDTLAWCASIWKRIQGKGWDGASKDLADQGAKLKGAWEKTTGEKYGSKKGSDWKPDLPANPAHMDEAELQQAVAAAEAERDEALKRQGAGTAELERVRELAGRAVPDVDALDKAFDDAEAAHAKAIEALRQTPKPDEGRHPKQPCPHCNEAVAIIEHREGPARKYELKAPGPAPSETEIKAMRKARHEAEFAEQRAERAVHEAAARANEAKRAVVAIQDAKAKLEQLEAEAAGAEGAAAAVEATREKVQAAQKTLGDFRRWREARSLHSEITRLAAVVQIMKPNGLRQRVLARVLSEFNERLAKLSDAAGWSRVQVKEDMSVIYGIRPALQPFSSESQVWRAAVTLQVAVAQVDGSSAVLIDRADVLDSKSRGGLLRMLKGCGTPALISMTAAPGIVPDLGKAKSGGTWVLTDGRAVTHAEATAPAAPAQAAE